ncbi:MAG: hypothetical protein HYY68_03495 [Thaumarchaeota archaeon]|nr:hypothetical protein [Nitrososphaerota archaeon]MBI3022775.1 hypothetical protein [Nitrososphaerota archaeon]MBI3116079.1 hypothetical protein [Nitrososphaerota archaeon]
MLDGKEVDVETAVAEARSLRRWTMILFAVAIAIVFAGLLLVFHPSLEAWSWLDRLVVRIEYVVSFGLIGIAGTFSLLDFYIRYSINEKGKALVFSRREKLAYTMILWLILGTTVISILW